MTIQDKEQLVSELEEHLAQVRNSTMENPFMYLEDSIHRQCVFTFSSYVDQMHYFLNLRIELTKIDRFPVTRDVA